MFSNLGSGLIIAPLPSQNYLVLFSVLFLNAGMVARWTDSRVSCFPIGLGHASLPGLHGIY